MGDNRDNSFDSRYFGCIDFKDIMGNVWIVYLSYGDEGIRWNRIGKTVK